jgi:integrase
VSVERRLTDSGAVRWDVRLRSPNGRQYKRTFRTRKEAERFQATELADRSRGNWIDPAAGRTTLSVWFEEWFATNRSAWRASTASRNEVGIRRHWIPRLGDRELAAITPRHVQRVVNELVEDFAPTTVRSYYGSFRSLMGAAVDMELIGRNPCRGIRLPVAKAKEKRVLTPPELHRLADAVGPQWRAMIYLAGVMGLRFGEVAAVRVGDVDLEGGRVTITRAVSEAGGRIVISEPKTTASIRALNLPDQVVGEIRRHIALLELEGAEELLFADQFGGPLRASNFRGRVFVPAVERAGLDGLTFHGLRHSAATIWMASGADARTVQHLLGHADPSLVLKLYAHAADDAVRRGAERAAEFYWGS